MSDLVRPLRLRPYRSLLLAYGISALGMWLGEIALAVLVLHETGSPAAVASIWVVGQFATALLVPAVVARVEHLPTRRTLAALLATEAALFALLAASAGRFSLALVLALVAVDGVATLTARALVKASMVAVTAPYGLLREGNSLLVVVFTSCAAAGPVAAGSLVAAGSVQTALAVDAFLLAGAAAAVLACHGVAAEAARERGVGERLWAGMQHVRERRRLFRLFAVYAVLSLFAAAVLPVEIVLVTDTLGGSEADYGLVLSLWGFGAVAGGASLPLLRRAPLEVLIAGSFTVFAISYVGMGTAASVFVLSLFSFVGGTANGIDAFAVMTAIQERTADQYQARVGGLFEALVSGATGIGFLVGGMVATIATPRAVYVLAGLGIAVATVAAVRPRSRAVPA
jgi:hypothetical protein